MEILTVPTKEQSFLKKLLSVSQGDGYRELTREHSMDKIKTKIFFCSQSENLFFLQKSKLGYFDLMVIKLDFSGAGGSREIQENVIWTVIEKILDYYPQNFPCVGHSSLETSLRKQIIAERDHLSKKKKILSTIPSF